MMGSQAGPLTPAGMGRKAFTSALTLVVQARPALPLPADDNAEEGAAEGDPAELEAASEADAWIDEAPMRAEED